MCVSSVVEAATLDYSVEGLKGKQRKNVLAYLGAAPDSEQERLNFVASARSQVESALQALGYYKPEITLDLQRIEPTWQLTITVEPGEPIHIRDISIQIIGAAANDNYFTRLIESAGLTVGDVLHHGRFETFRTNLLSLGQQRGYIRAELKTSRVEVQVEAGTADILILYNSGPRFRFGEIVLDKSLIDSELFESMLTFQPGDYFDQPKLQEFQARLQRTSYFSSVLIRPMRENIVGDQVPIAINLQPAKRHGFDVGVGYSTDTEERVSLTWRTPRINRYGHSQVTRVEYSPVNPSGRFTYTIPVTNPLNDTLQLWARVEENEFGDIDSRQHELGAKRETKDVNWIYGYSLRGLNESWHVLDADDDHDYLLLGGSLSRRIYSGSMVDPVSGFNQLYTLEGGNQQLGSDLGLLRMTADLKYVFTPWPRNRVVTRIELGAVEVASGERTELAPSLSFFAGGNQSIRGYAYQSVGDEIDVTLPEGGTKTLVVGGDRLVVGSLEYQHYFTDKWRGALFVDAGDAFNGSDFDAKVGAGFGVHYMTPVGAIRVELANSVSEDNAEWRLHLIVGAEF